MIRICESVADARSLRLSLLDEIRHVVRFDAYAWLLTDPETSVGCAPLADVPCLPELPRLIRLKYLTGVNRWTALDSAPVALLRDATDGDLGRSRVWREMLCEYDVGDVASTVFSDRFGCWGFLDLWRVGTEASFTPAEAAFLTEIVEPVTAALRCCQANTFTSGSARNGRRLGPVVLLLSPDLGVLAQTAETLEYLRRLVPPSGDGLPVPAGAYNVAAQLLAVEAGVDDSPPSARVHLADGRWVTLRAARVEDAPTPAARTIAVTIEDTEPAQRLDVFSRAFGLSLREGELLRHLATGMDTREVARHMYLSQHTVTDHLKAVFAKTSAHSRRELLSRALGT